MKSRTCQNCGEPFDRHDLIPFLSIRLGNTINCVRCMDLNYLVPHRNPAYWLVFCVSSAFALFTFSLFLDVLRALGLALFSIFGVMLATIICMVGLLVSLWVSRLLLKLWNWRNGNLTLDDNEQSVLDFGSW